MTVAALLAAATRDATAMAAGEDAPGEAALALASPPLEESGCAEALLAPPDPLAAALAWGWPPVLAATAFAIPCDGLMVLPAPI